MFVGSQRSSSKRPFNAYISSDHLIKRTILVRGQLISSNGSLFCIPRRGVHLRELSLYFPLSKKFRPNWHYEIVLSNHAQLLLTVKKGHIFSFYWLKETDYFIICKFFRNKSDSPFNVINVAIISYNTAIRRVSKLIFCHMRIFHSLKKGKIFSS